MQKASLLIPQLPEPFNFYRLVLDGDHLHFGLWPDGSDALTLEQAQEVLFNSVRIYFPDLPANVLDVGCGLGVSAYELSRVGYHVTGIAPSEDLIGYASDMYADKNLDFQVAGFMDAGRVPFATREYDVIFLQESLQYLNPLGVVFKRIRSLLKPNGIAIIGDEMCLDPGIKAQTGVHLLRDVRAAILENGFRIKVDQPVGKDVMKTCAHIISRFSGDFERIVSAVKRDDTGKKLTHFLNGWKLQKRWYEHSQMGYHILVIKKDKVFMKPYEDGDESKILPIFNSVFHQNRTLEHWYWKFRDSPFGRHMIAEAVTGDGTLAAQYCGYPVPFYSSLSEEKEFMALQIGDTMTTPKFRSLGLGTASVLSRVTNYFYNRFCLDTVYFNYGFNTGNIARFGQRFLQYESISDIPYLVIDLRIRKKNLKRVSPIRRFLEGLSVEKVSRIGEEYDRFFENVASDYGILIMRKASYLRWRYLDCPDKVHTFFAVRRFGRLVGWSVFSTRGEVLLWGDALFNKKYAYTAGFLLNFVVDHYYGNKTRIEGWFSSVPSWWTGILLDAGFEVAPEPNKLSPAFKIFDKRFSVKQFEQHFYYTMGDSDLF